MDHFYICQKCGHASFGPIPSYCAICHADANKFLTDEYFENLSSNTSMDSQLAHHAIDSLNDYSFS